VVQTKIWLLTYETIGEGEWKEPWKIILAEIGEQSVQGSHVCVVVKMFAVNRCGLDSSTTFM
jgi:hypothetical protein